MSPIDFFVKGVILAFGSKLALISLFKILSRDRVQTYSISIINLLIGVSLLVLLLKPEIGRSINSLVGFGENFNTLFFINFALIYVALVKLHQKIDQKERTISKLVREIAISNYQRTAS